MFLHWQQKITQLHQILFVRMKLLLPKFLFSLFALVLFGSIAYGQRVVTGRVTDAETGEALIGASIVVPGTTTGIATNNQGEFSLRVPETATQLRVTYTGYAATDVAIDVTGAMEIRLQPNAAVSEVLVIGYGTVRREDVTGSVVAVGTDKFNKGAIVAPQELIAGKISGVQVTPAPEAGGAPSIRIRGGSSLSATNDPLIVIDGVPVDNNGIAGSRNSLNILNPNDIESFTVLKDASATAIYGSRASNGVILITTKKGSVGSHLRVDYSGLVSFSNNMNQVDVLSASEYRTLMEERFPEGSVQRSLLGSASTNWQDEIYQTGVGHDHNVGISGAIGNLPYRVGLGYLNRTGTLKTDELQRLTGSLRLTPGFFKNTLQFNIGMKAVYDKNRFADRAAIGAAVSFDPTQPVRADGNEQFGGFFTWKQQDGNPNTIATSNPVARLEQTDDSGNASRYIFNASVDYRFWFLPDLRINVNTAYDYSESDGTIFRPASAAWEFVTGGRKRVYTQEKENSLFESYLNYNKTIARDHRLDVMAGYSWQHFFIEDFGVAYSPTNPSNTLQPANRDPRENYLLSVFGRINYSFRDRLLFTASIRRDGSSRFSEENRWGNFPGGAIAYKFIDNQDALVSGLKLRVGYGQTGQQDIGNSSDRMYAYLNTYLESKSTADYQLGGNFFSTQRPGGYDRNIKWETTETYNVAIDYGFWGNRINGTIEIYQRNTYDLLLFISPPAGTNLTNGIWTNVGDLENQGVEFSINALAIRNDRMQWEIGGNVTVNRNEITKLTPTDDPEYQGVQIGGISGGVGNTIEINTVGYASNAFYVYEQVYDGEGKPIEGLFADRNNDGVINGEDRYRYKNPFPKAYFGFYSNFTMGGLDFSFAGRANVGNYNYANIISAGSAYNNLFVSSSGGGYLNNVNSETAENDFNVPQYFSDHFVRNASFLRFDHITAGYTFGNLGLINRLRAYVSVQNPFVITKYEGLDPEIVPTFESGGSSGGAGSVYGIDNNLYPRSRTFVLGVSAIF